MPSVHVSKFLVLACRVGLRADAFLVLVNLDRYIKLVVIVNADRVVDKSGLLNRLKGLRVNESAEQGLRLGRTLTGKKRAVYKPGSSAHSILWICMGLSTIGEETACLQGVDPVCSRGFADLEPGDVNEAVFGSAIVEPVEAGFFSTGAGFESAVVRFTTKSLYTE